MAGGWAGIIALALAVDAAVVALGVALVACQAARRRGGWRAAFDRSRCEDCGEPVPTARLPRSWRQALRAGWTCEACGLECDKWGEAVGGGRAAPGTLGEPK